MKSSDFYSSPQVQWGVGILKDAICHFKVDPPFSKFNFQKAPTHSDQGYQASIHCETLTIAAETPQGVLYALMDLRDKIEDKQEIPQNWQDAPVMKYRGYCLGLQKQIGFYQGHKYYDWPISKVHFPWFYDKVHVLQILDLLAKQRCNLLALWSGHPFASLITLDEYPEMLEVTQNELIENQHQLDWLLKEAEKRAIQIFLHFYNIHMPAPLARSRGWDPMSGIAHEEICDYTRKLLNKFTTRFPSLGFIVCMGEVIQKNEQKKWLEKVIIPGILDAHRHDLSRLPSIILREHHFDLLCHFAAMKALYPNLLTMMKHNSENLISTRPAPENFEIVKISPAHLINVHLSSNLEPFSWGSPQFIRDAAEQMARQGASGVHVFPLRFWDWPNSSHVTPSGDQLFEHFVWWNAWGRYSWNPYRKNEEEEIYWQKALGKQYQIPKDAEKPFLEALQTTGTVIPEITSQFVISSGNRQNINLGQFLVPLAFSRVQYKGGSGYSMSQLCGFPLIDERMWSLSPVERLQIQSRKCDAALETLKNVKHAAPFLELLFSEIETLKLLTEYYITKAKATALYFQCLYRVKGSSEEEAYVYLEKSLALYRQMAALTTSLFRDAGSLHLHRTLPLPADEGYLHWKDCLPLFEKEAVAASLGGITAMLKDYPKLHSMKRSTHSCE